MKIAALTIIMLSLHFMILMYVCYWLIFNNGFQMFVTLHCICGGFGYIHVRADNPNTGKYYGFQIVNDYNSIKFTQQNLLFLKEIIGKDLISIVSSYLPNPFTEFHDFTARELEDIPPNRIEFTVTE